MSFSITEDKMHYLLSTHVKKSITKTDYIYVFVCLDTEI